MTKPSSLSEVRVKSINFKGFKLYQILYGDGHNCNKMKITLGGQVCRQAKA